MHMAHRIEVGFWICSNRFSRAIQPMVIKDGWKDTGNTSANAQDYALQFNGYCVTHSYEQSYLEEYGG